MTVDVFESQGVRVAVEGCVSLKQREEKLEALQS
jgi:hypothetical protein